MKSYKMISKCVAMILLLAFLSACASQQALIQSEPPGAIVMINGQAVGQTPLYYDYKLSSGKQHQVSISHQGYEEIDLTITADKTDTGALKRWLMAGVVWSPLWLGTLFTKKLKDSYEIVLQRDIPRITADSGSNHNRF